MRTRSFRFRLAIFSAMVSGVILLAFGLAAWVFVYKNLLKSVDLRLGGPAERMVRRVHEGRDWVRFREGMRFFGREFEQETVTMVVSNTSGKRLFASELSSWIGETKTFRSHLPTAKELAKAPPPPDPPEPRQRPDSPRVDNGLPPGLPIPGGRRDRQGPGGDRPRQPGEPRGQGSWQPIGEPHYFTVTGADGTRWRTVSSSNSSVTVFIGTDLAAFETEVRRVRSYFGVALPLGLLAIAAGAWAISRRAMRPLDRIISTASGMSAAELDKRIPVTGRESEEFSKLVEELNSMMDRLEGSFHQATRFTADASHELKTPIAIMQAEIESALKSCRPGSAEETSLLNLQEENQQLKRITQSLLLLSQVDSGKLKLAEEDVDLSGELEALAEDADYLCAKAGLRFSGEIAPGLKVRADRVLLMQAVQNLLSNAIKYNDAEGGEVTCHLRDDGSEVVVEFFNTGTPIPEGEQAKIFDRFYRVDKARGPGVEGFGLGLNLSLEIVRAHGGTLKLAGSDAAGTRMELRLPKV
ncbi:MAG: ATP-binding protein [Verrucomicrobiales bacterium]